MALSHLVVFFSSSTSGLLCLLNKSSKWLPIQLSVVFLIPLSSLDDVNLFHAPLSNSLRVVLIHSHLIDLDCP